MKYTIEGFSQEKMFELGLDAVDAVIMRWFVDFYPDMKKITEEGCEYGWVAYSHICEDLPIIRISNREVLGRRFKRLCETHILKGIKSNGNKTYFTFGPTYHDLVSSRLKSRKGTDLKVATLPTQKSDNPNTIDSSTNEKELNASRGRLIALYNKLYEEKAGVKAPKEAPMPNLLGYMLKDRSEEEIGMCMERYFKNGYYFTKCGYSFKDFSSHYSQILSSIPKKAEEEEEDYQCPHCGKKPGGHKSGVPFCFSCNTNCVEVAV